MCNLNHHLSKKLKNKKYIIRITGTNDKEVKIEMGFIILVIMIYIVACCKDKGMSTTDGAMTSIAIVIVLFLILAMLGSCSASYN